MKNKFLLFGVSLLTVLMLITGCGQKEFNVTFDTDGGSFIAEQTVKKNDIITKPETPTKSGYVFDEWTYEDDSYDFTTKVTKDITLKATWDKLDDDKTPKTFTVKFDTDGGNSINSQTVKEKEKAILPEAPKKSGYTFVKWEVNGETFDFNSVITKDITIKAIWKKNDAPVVKPEKNRYTVKFDSTGGSGVGQQSIVEGNRATQPGNPTKEGSNFLYWTLNGTRYDFSSAVNRNITLVAVWEVIPVVDKYTLSLGLINNDQSSIERVVTVFKNGKAIVVSQLLGGDNKIIGNYNESLSGIRVNKDIYQAATSYKVKLVDGTIVDIK